MFSRKRKYLYLYLYKKIIERKNSIKIELGILFKNRIRDKNWPTKLEKGLPQKLHNSLIHSGIK